MRPVYFDLVDGAVQATMTDSVRSRSAIAASQSPVMLPAFARTDSLRPDGTRGRSAMVSASLAQGGLVADLLVADR